MLKLRRVPPGSPNDTTFERLRGTRWEGEQIAALLQVAPLLEQQALEKRIKDSRAPRILHIASHGFFLRDVPQDPNQQPDPVPVGEPGESRIARMGRLYNPFLRSGLALAGANTWLQEQEELLPADAEDGLLVAEDVIGIDLLGTELVVLSACETGLGRLFVGEGIFGLQRAFVLAGARTLVMSLWKVPDQQTQELMTDFYRRMLMGRARADALREAQLTLKATYSDPFYWGAFICQGDPSSLELAAEGSIVQ